MQHRYHQLASFLHSPFLVVHFFKMGDLGISLGKFAWASVSFATFYSHVDVERHWCHSHRRKKTMHLAMIKPCTEMSLGGTRRSEGFLHEQNMKWAWDGKTLNKLIDPEAMDGVGVDLLPLNHLKNVLHTFSQVYPRTFRSQRECSWARKEP